jgi:cytochrome c-type biogenesis protein CcmH
MNSTPDSLDALKQQLAQLKELHTSGALPDAAFEEGKAQLERRILDCVLSGPANLAPAPLPTELAGAAPQASGMSSRAAAAAYAATAAATQAPVPGVRVRPSWPLLSVLTAGVVLLALAGYAWKGSPGGPSPTAQNQAAGVDAANVGPEQIAAMAEKLAERLKDRPDDVEGWTMLARSYSVLGRHPEALKAFETASNLRKDDPNLLADYADSMAMNQSSDLTGAPMKLVERALQLDPNNPKALYLAGTQAFNTQDFAGAITLWEKVAAVAPPGNVFAQEVVLAIEEARKRAGMPAAAKASPAAVSNGKVSGTVTLSAALAQQAQPEDTVFVFARAAEGSRMPLAILRKQVKDLPLTFELNDSMAMAPTSALSTVSQVIVGARISKSGNAMPQAGDLAGQSAPVAVGSSGLQIEIRDTVKP